MKTRSLALMAIALSTASAALAEAPERKPATPEPAAYEQTLLADLAGGMRDLLRAVVPEISLPAVELKLPRLHGEGR
jgi:hypothetical protein